MSKGGSCPSSGISLQRSFECVGRGRGIEDEKASFLFRLDGHD
jgi:hypothetical protein